MPELSRFYGIVIKMYHNDHRPPHFHAENGDGEIVVAIDTLAVISEKLRTSATGLTHKQLAHFMRYHLAVDRVMEWATAYQDELRRIWEQARNHQPLDRIDPLP
jgi:hypothetical protein